MGLYANLSRAMENRALEVFRASKSNIFRIKAKIISKKNSEIAVVPMQFDTWSIVHNFEKEYHEKQAAILNVSIGEAETLLRNQEGLMLNVVLEHVTQHYYRVLDSVPPQVKTYMLQINNNARVELEKSIAQLQEQVKDTETQTKYTPDEIRTMRHKLQVDLIDEEVYRFSKLPINSMTKQTTMESAVHYLANALGIKKVYMLAPDNNTSYKHLFFPPFTTIEAIDKLQQERGIYAKGVGYYYFEGALYVYPEFDTDPRNHQALKGELHLYRLPIHAYAGCASYNSADQSENIHVVLNKEAKVVPLAEIATEVVGNYIASRTTNSQLDVDTKQNGKDATVNKNNGISVAAKNPPNPSFENKVKMRWVNETNNALAMSSSMAAIICARISTQWDMAWPWHIRPGQKVIYHYEHKDGLDTATGIISSVEYTLSPIAGWPTADGTNVYYAWTAVLAARLSQIVTPTTIADSNDNISPYTKQSMSFAKAMT